MIASYQSEKSRYAGTAYPRNKPDYFIFTTTYWCLLNQQHILHQLLSPILAVFWGINRFIPPWVRTPFTTHTFTWCSENILCIAIQKEYCWV